MIPAPSPDLHVTLTNRDSGQLMGWNDDGHPMILRTDGTLRTVSPREVASVESRRVEAVIPGGGWQVAGINDGKVWNEPVIAWRFVDGIAAPVLPETDSVTLADTDTMWTTTAGMWLVPPGQNPGDSRYRPAEEAS